MEMMSIQKDLVLERKTKELAERRRLLGTSLGCLSPSNPFRMACCKLSRDPNFESLILFCIIAGSVMLACDGPTNNSSSDVWKALGYLDFGFVCLFTLEMCLKIVSLGFCWAPEAYLSDPWNQLDFVVVVVAWLSADYSFLPMPWSGEGGASVGALRTLRSLRALRPLRTIQRLPGMRLVVNVLFECAPVFVNICFVVLFFFVVFAIMGVQFFSGRFWSCNDSSVDSVDECWGCFQDPDWSVSNPQSKHCPVEGFSEREWRNQKMNFDNVFHALLTLYEVAGLEMWLDVMYAAMDTRPGFVRSNIHGAKEFPYGAQPKQEANWPAAFFFVVFVVVGVFIVLNLFVGAVVDKFNELKRANGGRSVLQTSEQAQYSESMALMARMRPFKKPLPPRKPRKRDRCLACTQPVYRLRMACYQTVMWDTSGKGMGTSFDLCVSALVLLNILVMGLYSWRRLPPGAAFEVNGPEVAEWQTTAYYQWLELLNNVFTFLFAIELMLKVSAWGIGQYWQDMWNKLDFVLVASSVVGFVVELVLTSGLIPLNPAVFRIVRVARLTRALKSIRMVGRIKGVARLVDTLVLAVPAMANVASLCFLVIFIFTVMGMDFFGKDDIRLEYVNGMYNQHCNFQKFGEGFMLLFRTVTGEAWNGVMHDMMVAQCDQHFNPLDPSHADYDEHFCGAPHTQAWLFFLVFNVMVTGLLFELITAIVLDEFGKMNDQESLPVNQDMIANFNDHWAQLDPKATQMIPQHKLLPFLKAVEPPIFLNPREAAKEVFKMNITATAADSKGGGQGLNVHYVDTLLAVVRYQYVKQLGEDVGDALDVTMLESPELTTRIVSAYPHLKEIEKMEPKDFRTELAATKVQQAFKHKMARGMIEKRREGMEVELSRRKSVTSGNIIFDGTVPDEVKSLPAIELQRQLRTSAGEEPEGGL